jgi:plastocyanin
MAAVALAAPASARADVASVAIPGKLFSPGFVQVVPGDSVVWRNSDFVSHDVAASDGTFNSGPLGRFGTFVQRFDAVGAHPFFCTIHPFMTGVVDVEAATLSGPATPVFAGEAVTLRGRAPAGTSAVTVAPGGAVAPAPDGTFAFTARPRATTVYRAVTPAGQSAPVTVTVSEAVKLSVSVTAHAVRVRTDPPRPGIYATVQRWARWRFDWRRVAGAKLDARGRATIPYPRPMTGKARVVLSHTARGRPAFAGDPLWLRTGRPTRVP